MRRFRSDCDSSWLSQMCSEHTEQLQTAPREGEEFVFASQKIGTDGRRSWLISNSSCIPRP